MLGMTRGLHYRQGVAVVTWRPWVAERWNYSGPTLGYGLPMHPGHGEGTWAHEMVHVRQYEDLNLLGFVLAGALFYWVGWKVSLAIWLTSGAPWLLPNYFTGWVRFKDAYYGSEHERSAYAQTGH